ncbi:Protein of unknown function DUF868, plant [Dillenia turbinata]|uniref:DUF868 domain-containing protein n=1 Tax=Dillenia turbinata TaxID=194707 RepID=A0AAN8UGW5_9MAGN
MSTRSSPFPSCFRPTTASTSDHHSPPEISGKPNLTTCLYQTGHGLFSLSWCRNLIGYSFHLHLYNDNDISDSSACSFSANIIPFWKNQGSRKLDFIKSKEINVFWDLTKAKFLAVPEPVSGFFIAVVVDGEMCLLVGDSIKEAYAKTRAKFPGKNQALVLRREHVLGNKHYTTKANFGGRTREISINCTTDKDSRLCFSIDGNRVLQIKRLRWKFRGNERIEFDGVPIQVSWDVYNWLFDDVDDGHAVFMFRFEKSGLDYEEEDEARELSQLMMGENSLWCGFGMSGFERKKMKKSNLLKSARSASSSSLSSASSNCSSSVLEWASMEERELNGPTEFSLLVYAWRS